MLLIDVHHRAAILPSSCSRAKEGGFYNWLKPPSFFDLPSVFYYGFQTGTGT
jgi:hypothetical protein